MRGADYIAASLVGAALWGAAASAHAQSNGARSAHGGILREPMTVEHTPVFATRAPLPRLYDLPTLSLADLGAGLSPVAIELPAHEALEPSPFVSFENNFAAEAMRVNPVTGWNWVGLSLGTASLGVAAVLFQVAGGSGTSLLPRVPGVTASDDPIALALGGYRLRYDDIGSLTMQAGMNAISSNLFQLLLAPSDRRTVRYMRTFVTELRDGWLIGFQSSM